MTNAIGIELPIFPNYRARRISGCTLQTRTLGEANRLYPCLTPAFAAFAHFAATLSALRSLSLRARSLLKLEKFGDRLMADSRASARPE